MTLLIIPTFVSADSGPKPTIEAELFIDGQPHSEWVRTVILTCNEEPSLYEYNRIKNFSREELSNEIWYGVKENPDAILSLYSINEADNGCFWNMYRSIGVGNSCDEGICRYQGILDKDAKLAFYIEETNTTIISDKIHQEAFYEKGKISISTSEESAIVEVSGSKLQIIQKGQFIASFIATLILELLVAWIFLRKQQKTKLLKWFALANIISLPLLWLLVPGYQVHRFLRPGIIIGEILVIAFEGAFVWFLSKKELSIKKSMIISVVANATSIILGGIIVFLLTWFIPWFWQF